MKKCCICKKEIDGVGNNARPFTLGKCCDACNTNYVIPYRLRLQNTQKTRIDADALAFTSKVQKHASAQLNAYIGKRVALTMCDGEVEVGTLHVDTPAIRFMTYAESDNKEIIGYYINRDPRGELHFRKSHVKHIKALDAINSAGTDAPIKTVYIPARAEHDGIHGVNVKLRWLCPKCGAPRGEVKSGRSYDGSRILFCDTWQNPCGHVDKYADVRAEAAANGLNGDVMSGGGVNDKPIDRPADNRSRQGVQP